MPSTENRTVGLGAVGAISGLLTAGILLLVVAVTDLLRYLDDGDLSMVGTTDSLLQVVLLTYVGALLLVLAVLWLTGWIEFEKFGLE
ncbi:hypothetical protein [Halolamina salifodinae]|uniref:Uncharacterized protein n=1 Tax=Halolamina salifodinae TaxID=1202767 RepID=A0A8T4GX84_9EURY|nr:hypothetical protein [Halolamina salifodinae]MBP1986673.1 hypothetical protein [Halolamina salifodinae]